MARRNRISWPLVGTLAAAICVGSLAGAYKVYSDRQHDAKFGASDTYAIDLPSSETLNTTPALAKPNQLAISTTRPAMVLPTKPIRQQQNQPAFKPQISQPPVNQSPIGEAVATATPPAGRDVDTAPRLSPDATPAYHLSNSADLFTQTDAKIKADDLLSARKQLVAALDSKTLSAADQDEAFKRLSQINETVVFSTRKFLDDPMQVQYVVKPGDNMQKIAAGYGVTWQFIGRLNGISDPRRLQAGKTLKIVKGPFNALVNKTAFTLDLYLGKPGDAGAVFVKRFRVGLGQNDSTPTGLWGIDTKLEKPRYYNSRSDGPRTVESGDPTNPLGTRWLALSGQQGQAVGKTSYGIHGTIDPTSIGQKKSEGCIRMLNEDVEQVYDILVSGKSTVTVTE